MAQTSSKVKTISVVPLSLLFAAVVMPTAVIAASAAKFVVPSLNYVAVTAVAAAALTGWVVVLLRAVESDEGV